MEEWVGSMGSALFAFSEDCASYTSNHIFLVGAFRGVSLSHFVCRERKEKKRKGLDLAWIILTAGFRNDGLIGTRG